MKLTTWHTVAADSDFSIYNLPFGIFSVNGSAKRIGVALGTDILDLANVARTGLFDGLGVSEETFVADTLNEFIGLGKSTTSAVRQRLQQALTDETSRLRAAMHIFVPQADATMHLPVHVGDYTDFYSSIEHATNVGKLFRDPANALLPNWKHLPVGYHGRSSSIVVSGTDFYRPCGQIKRGDLPEYSPSLKLDYELETAFIVGKNTQLGDTVSTSQSTDYIFGMVLMNDWSARDIQSWEYVPLGPFLGKNFCTSVSPWVVTMEALEPFRVAGPPQEPAVLPYLEQSGSNNYDVTLQVFIQPQGSSETKVGQTNFSYMYWSMAQQLAHHTVNGCPIRIGDLMGSGTISGPTQESLGSLLEATLNGKEPFQLTDGQSRTFIEDNDTVIIRGFAEKEGMRVGFGEVAGKVLPAK